jgi:hypothetical protein
MLHLTQMVNVGFPEKTRYGFEMVDEARACQPSHRRRVNRKFTANRNSWIFRQFSAN